MKMKSDYPIILGIDPGSRICGYGCLQVRHSPALIPSHFSVREAGLIRLPAHQPHHRRIGLLAEAIYGLLKRLEPDICVVERSFYGENISTAIKLGETRGAVISAIHRAGVAFCEVTPACVKKTIVGNGRASKEEVARVIEAGLAFSRGSMEFDVTDALAIALSHGVTGRFEEVRK